LTVLIRKLGLEGVFQLGLKPSPTLLNVPATWQAARAPKPPLPSPGASTLPTSIAWEIPYHRVAWPTHGASPPSSMQMLPAQPNALGSVMLGRCLTIVCLILHVGGGIQVYVNRGGIRGEQVEHVPLVGGGCDV
jgi:hypothetical protein